MDARRATSYPRAGRATVLAVDAIGDDPQELRRNLRDLVAVSILPAVWRNYNAQQIAESLTEALVRMLGLEFAYISVRWGDEPAVRVARTGDRTAPDPTALIRTRSAAGSTGMRRARSSRWPIPSAPARSDWRSFRSAPVRTARWSPRRALPTSRARRSGSCSRSPPIRQRSRCADGRRSMPCSA